MSMSKKDYEAIATLLRAEVDRYSQEAKAAARNQLRYDLLQNPLYQDALASSRAVRKVAINLAAHFAGENERFDRVKFLKAAGVQAQ